MITVVGLLGPALAALMSSCGGKQQEKPDQVPELSVMKVTEANSTLESAYPATLHGQNDVEIRPQVQGFITKVCVQQGQTVRRGQALFMIDQVQAQAAVDAARSSMAQAQASVEVAQANVNTAQTKVTNNKILLDRNIISPTAYQMSVDALNSAKAQLNQAKASARSAQANLVSARKTLSYSTVTAPVAGIVGTIDFKEGALVSPQTLLTVLSNNTQMEAYFSLTEKEVLALTDNGKRTIARAVAAMPEVSLKLADGEVYAQKGRITTISGVMDNATGAARVTAVFPNSNGMLRSGNSAQVLIPSVRLNVITIPQKATYEVQDMKYVFVVDNSGVVHSTPITVDKMNNGQDYIVISGLEPGQTIVTEGVGVSVQDKMKIKPKKQGL